MGKKRRPKGTGSISVRPDGKADADITLKNWDGSEHRERKRLPSEQEAERWLLEVRYEHERDMLPAPGSRNLTLGRYLEAWLKESVAGTVARHTQRDYEDKVRLHIAPALGRIRLQGLTTQHLNRFYRQKLAEGRSPMSVRYMHTTLSKALHEAEGADLVRKTSLAGPSPRRTSTRRNPSSRWPKPCSSSKPSAATGWRSSTYWPSRPA